MTGRYPFDVDQRGTDTSGRPILMSDRLYVAHLCFMAELATHPLGNLAAKTYVSQGSWMQLAGGGAVDSAGWHNDGGALDYSLKFMTREEQIAWAVLWRRNGGIAWPRGAAWGQPSMDVHGHVAFPWDTPVNDGVKYQLWEYERNGDGLMGGAPDYIPRPNPLVLSPPKEFTVAGIQDIIRETVRDETSKIAAAVWREKLPLVGNDAGEKPAARVLGETHYRAGMNRELIRQVAKDVAVDVGQVPIDAGDLQDALEAALAKAYDAAGRELDTQEG